MQNIEVTLKGISVILMNILTVKWESECETDLVF